ncbi:MAG TPA: HAD hydrolase-like protein [Verrucomicrobiae bacterium]|nr:HAD hydrolase-like protein [Verrucomicrobiae bacterium]
MRYRLLIFDSDGTLADTLPWMRSVFNDLAEVHGFRRVEPHEYEQFRDLHGGGLMRALGLPLWKLPRVVSDMRRRMAERPEPFELFAGIGDALDRLAAAGMRIGIVSSNSRLNVERILGHHAARVHHWACGASVFGKAAKIRAVIKTSGIRSQEVLYVGDEVRDAIACGKVGIHFGAVTWGQHSEAALRQHSPVVLFHSPEQMVEWICSGSSGAR